MMTSPLSRSSASPISGARRLSESGAPGDAAPSGPASVCATVASEAVGAVLGAAVDGMGVAVSTIAHLPRALQTRTRDAIREQHAPTDLLLALARVPADLALLTVAGTAYATAWGFVNGSRDAADRGLGASLRQRMADVRAANQFIHDWANTPIGRA